MCSIMITFLDTYTSLGCWTDKSNRAIPTLEGKSSLLDGSFTSRKDAIQKCFAAARSLGYQVFAVQDGGWCASSATAKSTFKKYGESTGCNPDGKGSSMANAVYEMMDGTLFK